MARVNVRPDGDAVDVDVDVPTLAAAMRRQVRGQVASDAGSRALYATDASNYRVPPLFVVTPQDVDDLVVALGVAREAGAPTVLRGGGTSIAGNAIGGVLIDCSRNLDHILDIDPVRAQAVVEPGVILTDLNAAAARHGLTFGADPSSASRATLGGMIANNACGAHSVAWGTTADSVLGLEVVTGDGRHVDLRGPDARAASGGTSPHHSEPAADPSVVAELAAAAGRLGARHRTLIERRFGTFSRQISGYALQHLLAAGGPDLPRLLTGSEGTLATTVRATLALTPLPAHRGLVALGFPDAPTAADAVPALLPHRPLTVESVNATLLDRLPHEVLRGARSAGLPPGTMWLLVEVGGDEPDAVSAGVAAISEAVRGTEPRASLARITDPAAQAVLWRARRDSVGLATRREDGSQAWSGWEDAAVPVPRLGEYLRRLDDLVARYGYSGESYGHFGEGCMHLRLDADLLTRAGTRQWARFVDEATDLVVSLGGSVSGEHGDGRARSAAAARMYGADAMGVFAALKSLFDPAAVLNPGVIADPAPVTADLRLVGTPDASVPTVLRYPQDPGGFAEAARRCVGVGVCRRHDGGLMCPSYQVTRREEDSTRGRAHLLWEMLHGELITDRWRSEQVRDALDGCLACKGCLSDCPAGVDMAAYKVEFTAQFHAGRPWTRPRSHWSLGWLPLWLEAASRAPRLVNALARSPLARPARWVAGVDPDRAIPAIAGRELQAWSQTWGTHDPERDATPGGLPLVVLWTDELTTHLAPGVAMASARVLDAAGIEVRLPRRTLVSGLTWLSTGQVRRARRALAASLARVYTDLADGAWLVAPEPSVAALLRHDATRLLDTDVAALAARRTLTLAEALTRLAPQWRPPEVGGRALVQVHCHQHAVTGFDTDAALLAAAGVQVRRPEPSCCGMAGSFGMEAAHAELSRAVGERVLIPAVRAADPETVLLADGISCRTQIADATGRGAVHLAQLLDEALEGRPSGS